MRKLGWVVIIGIIVALAWAVLALNTTTGPTVGPATKGFFVDFLGVNFVNGVTHGTNAIMTFGTVGFPQAIAVLLGTGVFFLVVGVFFTRFVWDKPATVLFKTTPKVVASTIREEPRDIIITQSPVPTTQQKEKEVTATESSSTAS